MNGGLPRKNVTNRICTLFVQIALSPFLAFFSSSAMAQPAPGAAKESPKPAPRLPDGKVDLGGKGVWAPIWVLDWSDPKYVDKAVDVPFTPWGLEKFKERRAN
jgi:hypothetical protein